MKGYETYRTYLAVMHHFNPKFEYDFFKYNGKAVCKVSTFAKNKTKWLFAKIEKQFSEEDAIRMFFFTFRKREFIKSPSLRLFTMNANESMEKYEAMFDSINTQIESLKEYMVGRNLTLEELISEENSYPILYNCVLSNIIDFELFEFLVNVVFKDINKLESTDPILWPTIVDKINLEKQFLITYVYPNYEVEYKEALSNIVALSSK
jgi:hypothetical protein